MDIELIRELKDLAWPIVGIVATVLAYMRLGEVARAYELLRPENLAQTMIRLEEVTNQFSKSQKDIIKQAELAHQRLISSVQNALGSATPEIEELTETGREYFAEISDIWTRTKDRIEAKAGSDYPHFTRYTYAKLVQKLLEDKRINDADAVTLAEMEGEFVKVRRKPENATAATLGRFKELEQKLTL
jgi:predicted transcriptional regulator